MQGQVIPKVERNFIILNPMYAVVFFAFLNPLPNYITILYKNIFSFLIGSKDILIFVENINFTDISKKLNSRTITVNKLLPFTL